MLGRVATVRQIADVAGDGDAMAAETAANVVTSSDVRPGGPGADELAVVDVCETDTHPFDRHAPVSEQIEVLYQVVERLERAGLEYMLSGSVALSLYATPRMTRDIDIVIALGVGDVDTLVTLFEKDFYIDAEMVANAVSDRHMFNIIHDATVSKLDFIVRKDTPYRVEEFSNRRRVKLGTREVWAVGPEDLVLSKLVWARDSGSERQLDDVRSVLEASALDDRYLARWAAELDVSDALERCRS